MTPEELKLTRKALGYSQRRFAERLGICYQTVVNWEKAKTKIPKFAPMALLAMAFEDRFILRNAIHRFQTEAHNLLVRAHAEFIDGEYEIAGRLIGQALIAHARNPLDDVQASLRERVELEMDFAKKNTGWLEGRAVRTSDQPQSEN